MASSKHPHRPPAGPPPPPGPSAWDALLRLAFPEISEVAERPELLSAAREALEDPDEELVSPFVDWAAGREPQRGGRAAPATWRRMLSVLLRRALSKPPFDLGADRLRRLAEVVEKCEPDSLRPIVGPALRVAIGAPRDGDVPLLRRWMTRFLEEIAMAERFFVDVSSIPTLQVVGAVDSLQKKVREKLEQSFKMPPEQSDVSNKPTAAAILGMVVLDGEVAAESSGLDDALRRAWLESIGEVANIPTAGQPGNKVSLDVVYAYVAEALPRINGGKERLAVQELAFVAREVIAGADTIPFNHPNFESAVRIALDRYVETRATGDSLSLPPGSLPGGTLAAGGDSDLSSDNIRVTGLAYSLALLERTLVFRVADRLAELFMNGLLPFGHDAAGKALDDYYWGAEDRLSESQRRSQYSRMLGMPGGEVSKDVDPNKAFEQLFLRFIASVSEFTRQREVDRMFTTRAAALSMTGEQVRKCAFELAKNASLYAWGGSFYVATRINKHLERAISILSLPQVLKAHAASHHWQVVERVAQQDFNGAPNWAKYCTMAQTASTLFDVLARNTKALASTSSTKPFLFDPSVTDANGKTVGAGDLSPSDTDAVLRSVQNWLAVNGMREEQVQQYAQPVELTSAPSLPNAPASRNDSGTEVVNKLKELVASGTPSPEQLQQLLGGLS